MRVISKIFNEFRVVPLWFMRNNYTWIFENRVSKKNQLILLLGNLKQWKIIQRPIKSLHLTPGSNLVISRSISASQILKNDENFRTFQDSSRDILRGDAIQRGDGLNQAGGLTLKGGWGGGTRASETAFRSIRAFWKTRVFFKLLNFKLKWFLFFKKTTVPVKPRLPATSLQIRSPHSHFLLAAWQNG